MKRHALTLLALILLSWPGRAAEPTLQQKGVLARAIRLEEEPEEKRGRLPMPFGTSPQDVDINSMIHIRISRDDLLQGLSGNPALTPAAREAVTLRQQAEELQQAEGFLRRAIGDAEALARLDLAGGRNTPEFREIAGRDQEGLRSMFALIQAHLDALNASTRDDFRQHTIELRARMSAAIPQGGRIAFAAVLVEEIRWTLAQLEQTRARVDQDAPPIALILSASHVRQTGESELGLPNYNDLPIGTPKSVDKLSLVLPPEQVALHQEAAALAGMLNRLQAESAGLREVVRQALAAQGFDFTEIEEALDKVKEDANHLRLTNWSQTGDQLESRLREALGEATGAKRQLLEDTVLPAVADLQARTRVLRSSLGGLVATVQGLKAQLEGTSSQSSADRVIGLLTVLQVGSDVASGDLFQDLTGQLQGWTAAARALQSQIETVRNTADELPAALQEDILEILTEAGEEPLGDLVTHLQELRTSATGLVDRFQGFSTALKGAPALAIALARKPPDTSFRVSFPDIKDSWLDVRTLNPRSEDEVVVLRAWLFRMKPDPNDPAKMIEAEELDSDLQQLRILRFGWYSSPAVGLVYVRSQDEVTQRSVNDEDEEIEQARDKKQTRMFAPQVSWLFRYRAWQEAAQDPNNPPPFRFHPRWWSSLGVGLHTVTLDLDNDNQQEMGLGVSISFFKDFFQIGAGWDLSLDDEPYFFVGTRLLEIARNLGENNKPAAPPE